MGYKSDLEDSQPQLEKFVGQRIYDKEEASDVIQNVNLVAINKEKEYDSSKNFLSWLYGIAKFQIMAYLKSRKRNKILYVKEYHQNTSPELVNKQFINFGVAQQDIASQTTPINQNWLDDAPFADIIEQERLALLKKLDNYLGNKEKIVFNLLVDGFTIHEIAEKTGMKIPNISVTKSRLISKIKEVLKKQQEDDVYD